MKILKSFNREDLSAIRLPIGFHEPISILQKTTEMIWMMAHYGYEYHEDPCRRMADLASICLCSLS